MPESSRPRLLYFNGPWDYLGERLRVSYVEPFRRLLDQDFEVISVEGDCDFRREVETHRPDVVLFHAGTESPLERESVITNTDAFPEIPRMGWVFRDPFSPSRLASMNRLRAWGVNQVFTDFQAADCPVPFFADSIYVPWWIDDTVFRDHGLRKDLPITLTGSGWLARQFYVWRQPVFLQLAQRLPIYHVPAFETHQKNDAYIGESYARLLNRSLFSAGCGSVCRYVTLKMLEIPGSRCCLVTEDTVTARAFGFVDGVNCIFADEKNVVAKVQALLDDPARLRTVTDAGFELVHSRHTQRQRRMFFEWYQLWKTRQPGQRIVQAHPLEPLRLAAGDEIVSSTFPHDNPLLETVREGYRLIDAGKPAEALEKFTWVQNIISYVAEANLGVALCHLLLEQPAKAVQQIDFILTFQAKLSNYPRPDPVSLAFGAVARLRLGQPERAFELLARHSRLKHPALNALRWQVAERWPAFRSRHPDWRGDEASEAQNTESIQLVAARDFSGWTTYWAGWLPALQPAEARA